MNTKGIIVGSRKGIFILLFILIMLLAGIFLWQTAVAVKAKTYYKEVELNKQKQEYIERVGEILKAKQEQEKNIQPVN